MTACKYDGKSCVYYKWTSELKKIRVQSINIVSKDKGLESAYRNELYNYLSVNIYFMKFILSFHHKLNHLIEYFSLWCHLYLYLILIVMSFVPNINIRYIWHHHEKSNHHFLCSIFSRLTSFLFEWFKFNTYLWFGDWNANHWQKKMLDLWWKKLRWQV